MPYKITLLPGGQIFESTPDQNIIQAAIVANILMPHGCKAGQCGRCKSRLIEGKYSYPNKKPEAISHKETKKGLLLCCQARPKSDLIIEKISPFEN